MKYLLESPVKGIIEGEHFKTTIAWRNGMLISDEPERLGGKDLGPDPYTLLLSSLVACTLATLRMYIDQKGLPFVHMEVEANLYYRIEEGATITQIERKIYFREKTDAAVEEKLLSIAENCPVSRMLKGSIRIQTELMR